MIHKFDKPITQDNGLQKCSICLLEFDCSMKQLIVICSRKHTICYQCLKMLRKPQKCPYCRELIGFEQIQVSWKICNKLYNKNSNWNQIQHYSIDFRTDNFEGRLNQASQNHVQVKLDYEIIFKILGILINHLLISTVLILSAFREPHSICLDAYCFFDFVTLRSLILYLGIILLVLSFGLMLLILLKLKRCLKTQEFLQCYLVWVQVLQLKLLVSLAIGVLSYYSWTSSKCKADRIQTYNLLFIFLDVMMLGLMIWYSKYQSGSSP